MNRISFKNFFPICLSFLLMMSLSSCWKNKDAAQISLNISLLWDGQEVSITDTVTYQNTMPLRLEKFKTYIDNISLRDVDGNWINSGSIDLIEFMPDNEVTIADFAATEMRRGVEIDAIRFGIGVPSEINVMDNAPINFENDHPLGIVGGAGMYWTWETGYIFSKFEGKIALSEGEDFTIPFAFHTGLDEFYREVVLDLNSSVVIAAEENHSFDITLDLSQTISSNEDELDLINNGITHTLNNLELAERYVNLLEDAWEIDQ